MNYIELSVNVEPKEQGSDVLIAQLAELGFESFVETEKGFLAYIPETDFNLQQLKLALSFYTDFFKFEYTSKLIQQQNWNKEWETNFQPISVDGKCYVRAPFHEAKQEFLYDVIIEPKMSFGTGHHSTTQLMIRKLMQLDIQNKSLLDMGCGTGVLAIELQRGVEVTATRIAVATILAAQLTSMAGAACDYDDVDVPRLMVGGMAQAL